jgi:hypothetical protein
LLRIEVMVCAVFLCCFRGIADGNVSYGCVFQLLRE